MALQMINKKVEYEQFTMMFEFNMEGILDTARRMDQRACIDEMQKLFEGEYSNIWLRNGINAQTIISSGRIGND